MTHKERDGQRSESDSEKWSKRRRIPKKRTKEEDTK
jgi:hypothetical protein